MSRRDRWALRLTVFLLAAVVCSQVVAGPVIVRTRPPVSGARIKLGSKVVGVTGGDGTTVITGIKPGVYTVRVEFPDGGSLETVCKVEEGGLAGQLLIEVPREVRRTATTAKTKTAMILVTGNVGNATIEIDGKVVGRTGTADGSKLVALAPGEHTVRVRARGYSPYTTKITVRPGPTLRVGFQLHPKLGAEAPRPGPGLLTWILVGLLAVAVAVAIFVALHLVRSRSRRPVTTQRIDRYEIVEPIGRGGMATVYRAVDAMQGRRVAVALKVLDEGHLADTDLVRKFLREGEILRTINERDPEAPVVQVYHHGRAGGDGGRPFIAMELLEGEDLLQHLRRRGRLEPREAVNTVAGVARALQPAHAIGVYHRDLTPDNVILVGEPRGGYYLRLIDFGVARHEYTSHGTLDGSIAGKPPYMSPEQCQGIPVDGRSDIYALGVMLYSLTNGAPPFTHKNPLEVMRMHKEENVQFSQAFPEPMVAVLQRALAKDPANRHPDIRTFKSELDRLLQLI